MVSNIDIIEDTVIFLWNLLNVKVPVTHDICWEFIVFLRTNL